MMSDVSVGFSLPNVIGIFVECLILCDDFVFDVQVLDNSVL